MGTGLSGLAGYQSARAQQEAAQQNAANARAAALATSEQRRRDSARKRASSVASFAASGVDLSSGASLSTISDIAAQQEELALLDLYRGEVQAHSAEQRAAAYGQQATGNLILGGTGLLASGLGSYYTYQNEFGAPNLLDEVNESVANIPIFGSVFGEKAFE